MYDDFYNSNYEDSHSYIFLSSSDNENNNINVDNLSIIFNNNDETNNLLSSKSNVEQLSGNKRNRTDDPNSKVYNSINDKKNESIENKVNENLSKNEESNPNGKNEKKENKKIKEITNSQAKSTNCISGLNNKTKDAQNTLSKKTKSKESEEEKGKKKLNSKGFILFKILNTRIAIFALKKFHNILKLANVPNEKITKFHKNNPLISTKFTQCGNYKSLKKIIDCPISKYINNKDEENLKLINELSEEIVEVDSFFKKTFKELIKDYYQFAENNDGEISKLKMEKDFEERLKRFKSKKKNMDFELINLDKNNQSKNVCGYLEFLKLIK